MAKPFDATARELIELDPAAWLAFLHIPVADPTRVRVIDSDLSSTVTAEADKVLLIDDPAPWLAHIELQASRDPGLPERMFWYNVLLRRRHQAPVRSVMVLLRPEADAPNLTGTLTSELPAMGPYLSFRFDVVRVWQEPVAPILTGGLATLPLAPVSKVRRAGVPRVLRALGKRYRQEARSAAEPYGRRRGFCWDCGTSRVRWSSLSREYEL